MKKLSVLTGLLALAACSNESFQPEAQQAHSPVPTEGTQLVLVLVDSCYHEDGEFELSINGNNIPIVPIAERDDTLGLCGGGEVALPETIEIELSGYVQHRATLQREDDMTLVISIASPIRAKFWDEAQLLYD